MADVDMSNATFSVGTTSKMSMSLDDIIKTNNKGKKTRAVGKNATMLRKGGKNLRNKQLVSSVTRRGNAMRSPKVDKMRGISSTLTSPNVKVIRTNQRFAVGQRTRKLSFGTPNRKREIATKVSDWATQQRLRRQNQARKIKAYSSSQNSIRNDRGNSFGNAGGRLLVTRNNRFSNASGSRPSLRTIGVPQRNSMNNRVVSLNDRFSSGVRKQSSRNNNFSNFNNNRNNNQGNRNNRGGNGGPRVVLASNQNNRSFGGGNRGFGNNRGNNNRSFGNNNRSFGDDNRSFGNNNRSFGGNRGGRGGRGGSRGGRTSFRVNL